MKLTVEKINELRTPRGGFTRAVVELLGAHWPPEHGWMKQIIGKSVNAAEWEALEQHSKKMAWHPKHK